MKILEIAGSVASVISLIIALYFQWQGKPDTQRNLAVATTAIFLILTVIAFFERRKTTRRARVALERGQKASATQQAQRQPEQLSTQTINPEYETLTGTIKMCMPIGSGFDVYYKKRFKRHPHLEIQRETLSGVCQVTSQRTDGFRIVSNDGMPLYLNWKAEGEFSD